MDPTIEQLRARIAAIEAGDAGTSHEKARSAKRQPASHGRAHAESAGSPCSVARGRFGHPGASDAVDAEPIAAKPSETDQPDERFTYERAMRKIERLASGREQASSALRARLVRDGFSAEVADEAVGRACACGLVDDARYADVLVRSRLAQGQGVAGIERELAALDIDASTLEELAAADDHDAELARALALLDRKPPRAKNKREAAYRRLVQKGYSSSVASSAARRWAEAQE